MIPTPIPCPECDASTETIYEDYIVIYGHARQLLIKNLAQQHCPNCGVHTLSSASQREIERLKKAAKDRHQPKPILTEG